MQYLLLIYHFENEWAGRSTAEQEVIYREYRELIQELHANGQLIRGDQLRSAASSVIVRLQNGNASTTDGPFAETKEQLAGFYLVEARDLNDAIQIASKIPPAREGSVEVRPVRDLEV